MGFSISFRVRGTVRESCGSGIVGVDDVYCVSLVVFLNTYEGELSEDSGSVSKLQVKLVCNCLDEVVYCFVDFLGRGVGEGERLRA